MSKQILDDTYAGTLLHEMCGKSVPEGMKKGRFGNLRSFEYFFEYYLSTSGAVGMAFKLTLEKVGSGR